MQKGSALIFLLVGVLVIIVAGGAFYLGKLTLRQNSSGQTTPKPSSVTAVQPTPQTTPVSSPSDETANWKTYTDTQLGFSLKYPEGWIVESAGTPSGSTRLNNNNTNWGKIATEQNKKTYQVIDDTFGVEIVRSSDPAYISDIGENRLIKSETTVVDGITGKKQYFRNSSEPRLGTGVAVKITRGKYTYSIAGGLTDQTQEYLDSQYAKIFDQILSTFRFD
ncbi:hypothetical protein HYW41_04455 [Candidatus Daviesbacteria bacterium]|nr:hypothetical protein [Candidatus Daviesbacteria bacterium]